METAKPKKCFLCEKEATVFVTFIEGDTIKEVAYCKQHAEEQGFLEKPCYQLIDRVPTPSNKIQSVEQCPQCHMRLEDFMKSKLMGCAHCYHFFKTITQVVLRRLYETPVHFGKIPKACCNKNAYLSRIQLLKKRVEACVSTEDFEQAAFFKKRMKTVLRQSGGAKKKSSRL